jgi:hypothetical protein
LSLVAQALDRGRNARVILLSDENLTNYFYDLPTNHLSDLRTMLAPFDTKVAMVLRMRCAFGASRYKQAVINPPEPRYENGTALTMAEYLDTPRMRRLLDYRQLTKDVRDAFGAPVRILRYELWWFRCIAAMCGFQPGKLKRENTSLPSQLVETVREINAMGLPNEHRDAFLAILARALPHSHAALNRYTVAPHLAAQIPEIARDVLSGLSSTSSRYASTLVDERLIADYDTSHSSDEPTSVRT